MLYNRYKLQRNNGLLPKIQPPAPERPITSYCLLNQQSHKEYKLVKDPLGRPEFVMFNQKEYLHRKCSFVTESEDASEVVQAINSLYPQHDHTLTVFVANQPQQADQLILGLDSGPSLLTQAYANLRENQQMGSKIYLSIIGIQSENSLTDQLNFEWIEGKEFRREEVPLKAVVSHKQRLKMIKRQGSKQYFAQKLTRHELDSKQDLSQILKRYKDIKAHFQKWILDTQFTEYYQLGQLYHLIQTKTQDEKEILIKSHYILRVNQYIRTTSPLMLRLGMNLRKVEENERFIETHESKLFKLLSECFSNEEKIYHYHMFLQVGQYQTIKEEYLCLVPVSDFHSKQMTSGSIIDSRFFYTKQIMEYPELYRVIDQFNKSPTKITALPIIPSLVKERFKTRSYISDTYSSQEKRIGKYLHLTTEPSHEPLDLQQLVNKAAKIYRLPTPTKEPTPAKEPTLSLPKNHSNLLSKKFFKKERASMFEESHRMIQQKETNFQKRQKEINFQKNKEKRAGPESHFFEKTKEWLGVVYGRSGKKLKGKAKRGDEAGNALIRELLSKQLYGQDRQEVDGLIDRFS